MINEKCINIRHETPPSSCRIVFFKLGNDVISIINSMVCDT